jgi:hypothetical protein
MSAQKWDQVKPAGRGKKGLAGDEVGAKGTESSAAKRLSRSEIAQTRKTLETMTPAQMLGVIGTSTSKLTHKQRAFAYNVAMGQTKAEAYRSAYKRDASKHTLSSKPYHLAVDDRIKAEIEAYRLASEAAKHRTPQQIRDLVIQSLVQHVIDPDTPPAIRVQATKILGQVTEVAAFTERKESVVHHTSDKLRADIFAQVQALMQGKTVEGERIDQDAASLMAELSAPETETETETDSSAAASDTECSNAK